MDLYEKIRSGQQRISLVGLGYVGMPIAVAFAKKARVIGFDINKEKVELYQKGIDPTKEVGEEEIQRSSVEFTYEEERLKEAKFHIIAVPTPVNTDHTPDLRPLITASHIVGRNLTKRSVVVYESTVYPGVTEEICIPILEKESGLGCGKDFKAGYSPERINPGDKQHRLNTIVKVVSGSDDEALDTIAKVYGLVAEAGVYKAESIRVAEAAKVIENSQRDINIAFMNELSILFHRMGLDTQQVLKAAGTKWNFLPFSPGLVGGHCIGVDPYYLTYQAEQLGYHSKIILSGRQINDDIGRFIAEQLVKYMIKADIPVKAARVAILGLCFKENCPDTRNTKVMDIVKELKEYGIQTVITDPQADEAEAYREYGISLVPMEQITDMDAVVIAVAHNEFKQLTRKQIEQFFRLNSNRKKVLLDVKSILDRDTYETAGYLYWSL